MKRFLAASLALVGFLYVVSIMAKPVPMAIMGDAGRAGSELDRLKASLMKEKVMSIIMPGDNLYSGSYESVWDNWKKSGFKFDVVAIGNHNDGYAKEVNYFAMPSEFYSVVKNGARFIVLNSDNSKNLTAQFSFLEKEINGATEKLIFLVYHHPTFTISKSHKWTEKKDFQLKMRQIFNSYSHRITAVFLGHDHMTEFLDFGSVPAIVAGSGREARNEGPIHYTEDGFQIATRFLAPQAQHWVRLDISDDASEATATIVRVTDQKRICTVQFKNKVMSLLGECASRFN